MELMTTPGGQTPAITVTFLHHSGFLVELPSFLLLFDWTRGTLPPLPEEKPLLVFVSHHHDDHFNPKVFSLFNGRRTVRFFLGKDLRLTPWSQERWGLSRKAADACCVMRGNDRSVPLPGVLVETLPSTDEGVAFLVRADGYTVYHGGDLNWWHWPEQDKGWNRNMEVNYKRYLEPLRGRSIDLAMVPLDPELEAAAGWGLSYLLELAEVRYVLPMHQWDLFGFTETYLQSHDACRETLLPISGDGEQFFFQ